MQTHAQGPMQSPVNWALLGLIIERPSYAYELARRFERTYSDALSLSSVSHVYTALATLRERGLIQESGGPRGERSRRRFEPTQAGLAGHARWLVGQVVDERRRQRVMVAQIGALAQSPARALEVLDAYERACLAEAAAAPAPGADEGPGTMRLAARLIGEETRLSIAAKLQWTQYARVQLRALTERTGNTVPPPSPT